MNWYANNSCPTVEIPPVTMGPIADSAMWVGVPDILIRGLINGMFFAYIMRWFLRLMHKWWGLTVYVSCYSTCILTVKYTIFPQLALIEKNLIPTLLLLEARACCSSPGRSGTDRPSLRRNATPKRSRAL